jgi:GMP synthase-like glutamine amidotransferase
VSEHHPHLLVVDPAVHVAEDEGAAEIARGFEGRVTVLRPAMEPRDFISRETGWAFDGVAILGSAASVHDDLPWIRGLREWLRPLLTGERRIPLLGVCFGHQLVAFEATGGAPASVQYMRDDHEKLVGVQQSVIAGARLLPGRHLVRTLVSHREEVRVLPKGYRSVGHRPPVLFDALEHEALPIFTVQFHPEARAEFAARRGLHGVVDAALRESTGRLLEAFRAQVQRAPQR